MPFDFSMRKNRRKNSALRCSASSAPCRLGRRKAKLAVNSGYASKLPHARRQSSCARRRLRCAIFVRRPARPSARPAGSRRDFGTKTVYPAVAAPCGELGASRVPGMRNSRFSMLDKAISSAAGWARPRRRRLRFFGPGGSVHRCALPGNVARPCGVVPCQEI